MYIPLISELLYIHREAKRRRELVRELREFEEKWHSGDETDAHIYAPDK